MATQYDPIAKDETFNTTEQTPRNVADVLAEELAGIASAIGGGSGHIFQNPAGTDMPQEPKAQFVDSHLTDDSQNGKTLIQSLKPVTSAAFETETEDGFYFITDEDEQPLTADDIPYDSNNSVGDMLDAESSYTHIGDSIFMRLIGNGLVQWYSSAYNATTAQNTEYTFASTIPSKYRPKVTTFDTVSLYGGSGHLSGASTMIMFGTDGSIKLRSNAQTGIGIAGGGVYSTR